MRKVFGAVFPIVSIFLLLWVEQGMHVSYIWKTGAKAVLFLVIPFLLFRATRFAFLRFRETDRRSILIATGIGFSIMVAIIGTFLLLKSSIDLDALIADLTLSGITRSVFPFIALYILFGNSMMEEFFFRGILPDLFGGTRLRFLLPPLFFAIYHIAIFLPWFSPPILALAVAGLWAGGLIFQWANEKSRTILPSWIIHLFADFGILIIGVYVLYFY
ncbi:CPBP family intramembrane metalloprotease [Sporosarcina sp. Sa2YVA2]|uniref:CPBP family intramembrane metalloprotease n=1 Tax=Sporosarcina quadrami TaxID=2762234 RepID=A0ABR8UCH4_9BACL|nr:CPBP family intramembrane glutamic endopeptidase [Sporosarcina quadrami]MBD7985429.1 CPBP family intramembrane metalloprotease [Sporosarcina quadrami]